MNTIETHLITINTTCWKTIFVQLESYESQFSNGVEFIFQLFVFTVKFIFYLTIYFSNCKYLGIQNELEAETGTV